MYPQPTCRPSTTLERMHGSPTKRSRPQCEQGVWNTCSIWHILEDVTLWVVNMLEAFQLRKGYSSYLELSPLQVPVARLIDNQRPTAIHRISILICKHNATAQDEHCYTTLPAPQTKSAFQMKYTMFANYYSKRSSELDTPRPMIFILFAIVALTGSGRAIG